MFATPIFAVYNSFEGTVYESTHHYGRRALSPSLLGHVRLLQPDGLHILRFRFLLGCSPQNSRQRVPRKSQPTTEVPLLDEPETRSCVGEAASAAWRGCFGPSARKIPQPKMYWLRSTAIDQSPTSARSSPSRSGYRIAPQLLAAADARSISVGNRAATPCWCSLKKHRI